MKVKTSSILIFDESRLTKDLSALPFKHRVAFAASCCERLLPNYRAFSLMEHWGDPLLLRQALDEVWGFLEGDSLPPERVRELVSRCEAVTPDTENYTSLFTSAALDAASAVRYCLECCLDGDPKRAAAVGSLARDSVDMYIQMRDNLNPSDSRFEQKISADPLMVEELEQQGRDLERLKSVSILDSHCECLRQSSSVAGLQPFSRGIIKVD